MTLSTGMTRKDKLSGGFTLIELLCVVLLLAAFIGLAAPVFRGAYQNIALDVAADRLLGLLAYARERAVVERSRLRLEIDNASGSYRLLLEDPALPGNLTPLRESIGRGMILPDGTGIASDRSFIEFLPDGSITGRFITIKGEIGDVRRIGFDPITGEAKVFAVAQG